MYVKIEWLEKKTGLGTVKGFDCRKYRLWDQEDSIFIRFDDSEETYDVSECKVYIMNDGGKTMDRLV